MERYDEGKDTVPKIAAFVRSNEVIVVSVDGYVAEHYEGSYGGSPWDLGREGGDSDFGAYFQELAAHIDGAFRTLTDRRHRATSGLSMGGFMSLFLSARYPDLIGSASAFNPGPEFHAGDKGQRTLWRPKDHVANHSNSMVRLVRASGDYISQYHEETRRAYARAPGVNFEFRQDEYHRHWATSIAETFDFHMRAFGHSELDNTPEFFSHDDAYESFDVWGYHVEVDRSSPGITSLRGVRQGGMRITTRRWAPDGPPAAGWRITVTTPPLYRPGKLYRFRDLNLEDGKSRTSELTADARGRLKFVVDGAGHQLSFDGPGTGAHPPVLLPPTRKDLPRLPPGRDVALPLRVYNPRGKVMTKVKVEIESEYPAVELPRQATVIDVMEPGSVIDLSNVLRARFTAGEGYFARARIDVRLTYDGWQAVSEPLDLLIIPENIPTPHDIETLDGRTVTFQVFRQRGNQGGGESIEREVTEGSGDGDGVLEPGEEATIWVKMKQGMDPFDKNNWYRAKIYSGSPWISEVRDIQEAKQREWTGAQSRTSVIRLAPETPAGTLIALLLDNESWSFHFTPDVRYGRQKLYQAFQLHRRHLHRHELRIQ